MQQNKIGFICPTTMRVAKYNELEASFNGNNAGKSVLIPAFAKNEFEDYGVRPNQHILDKNEGLTKTLNTVAKAVIMKYKYLAFIADDFVIQTKDFDQLIIDYFDAHPEIMIVYCNDLYTSSQLATHWIVRSKLIAKFKFLSLPRLQHMFTDNFWYKIGHETNSIAYLDHIILEHKHFANRKSAFDETYKLSNNDEVFKKDQEEFWQYIDSNMYYKHKLMIEQCKNLKN